jgi:hypothetical protein
MKAMNKTSQTTRIGEIGNSGQLLPRLMLLTLISMVTACAGQVPVQPVAAGTQIHLITTAADIKTPDAKTAGAMVSKNAAMGAGAGAVGGAGLGMGASIVCGPFFILCAPVMAGGGAAIGLVAGTAAGAIDGGMKSLPKEKADALQEVIAAAFTEMDLAQTLRGEFEQQHSNRWTISDAEGNLQVMLTVDDLYIEQLPKDHLSLQMRTSMIVRHGPDEDDVSDPVFYQYRGPSRHVDYWIAENGRNFRTDISRAYETNIGDMIRTLKHGNGD